MFCRFRYCGSLQFTVSTCNTFSNFKARALVGFQSQKRSLVQATKWALESLEKKSCKSFKCQRKTKGLQCEAVQSCTSFENGIYQRRQKWIFSVYIILCNAGPLQQPFSLSVPFHGLGNDHIRIVVHVLLSRGSKEKKEKGLFLKCRV